MPQAPEHSFLLLKEHRFHRAIRFVNTASIFSYLTNQCRLILNMGSRSCSPNRGTIGTAATLRTVCFGTLMLLGAIICGSILRLTGALPGAPVRSTLRTISVSGRMCVYASITKLIMTGLNGMSTGRSSAGETVCR